MKLDLFHRLINNPKDTRSFIKELEESIESPEKGILEEIQSKNKVSFASKNSMKNKRSEILKNFANKTGDFSFVVKKSEENNTYTVFNFRNGKKTVLDLTKKDMPANATVNSVLRLQNDNYVLDKSTTKLVIEEITRMANRILELQNKQLSEFRKERHLYMVEEDRLDSIYLLDLTDESMGVLEEVDFPEDLKSIATEGTVFQYINGKYEFYSRDGFERKNG